MTGPESPTPAVRRVTVAAVLLVALVAAVVSYAHMQEVAARSGEDWRSYLLPLSVDGLVVAASMVLLTRHRAGVPGGWLPWCALLGAVGASLAANVAAAEPTPVARLVAAWPAVAFAVAFELLLAQRRPAGDQPEPAPEPAGWEQPARVGDQDTHPVPLPAPTVPAAPPRHDPVGDRVAALVAAGKADGRPVGRRTVARELDVSEHEARRLLAAATNGTGGAS